MRPAWGAWVKVVCLRQAPVLRPRCAPQGAHGLQQVNVSDGDTVGVIRHREGAWIKETKIPYGLKLQRGCTQTAPTPYWSEGGSFCPPNIQIQNS